MPSLQTRRSLTYVHGDSLVMIRRVTMGNLNAFLHSCNGSEFRRVIESSQLRFYEHWV